MKKKKDPVKPSAFTSHCWNCGKKRPVSILPDQKVHKVTRIICTIKCNVCDAQTRVVQTDEEEEE